MWLSTCLNHNSLVSQKKSGHQGHITKGFTIEGIVMCLWCYWKDLAMGYKYTLQNNVICYVLLTL